MLRRYLVQALKIKKSSDYISYCGYFSSEGKDEFTADEHLSSKATKEYSPDCILWTK